MSASLFTGPLKFFPLISILILVNSMDITGKHGIVQENQALSTPLTDTCNSVPWSKNGNLKSWKQQKYN